MIGRLRGHLVESGGGEALIDVAGVGYLVFASSRTLDRLARQEGEVTLLIETHVREDHIHLFGFAEAGERSWFRLLQSVQGVGSKVALAILSALTPAELTQAIASNDKQSLLRASGVGPRLAQRLLTELKDRIGDLKLGNAALAQQLGPGAGALPSGGTPAEDATAALVGLGYRAGEAAAAVAKAGQAAGEGASLEALIKDALRELAK